MKKSYFIIYILIFIIVGAAVCLKVANGSSSDELNCDATEVNRRIIAISKEWSFVSSKRNELVHKDDSFDYTVIGMDGTVYIMTRKDMANTVSAATKHYDIIRDIELDGEIVGRIIIRNPSVDYEKERNLKNAALLAALLTLMLIIILIYFIHINRNVVGPFQKMKDFAVRVASGNLDTPLEMDKGNVFGDFTEAFDIMREELKASREREEAAIRSRKELVAELSHDIKTPVASIKAMADVMSLTAKDDLERDTIASINGKADQIDKLISNLFHATLEELEQLEVHTEEISSKEILQMIREADNMKKVVEMDIKDAILICDKLRINQVISNIISNSYKYAGTEITVSSRFETNVEAESNLINKGMNRDAENSGMNRDADNKGTNRDTSYAGNIGTDRVAEIADDIDRNENIDYDTKDNLISTCREYYILEISDKGGGVPESELEIITKKFKRGSNSEGKDGSGLGLYISKYLLEKMGGGLECTNNGEGLTVLIQIQIA